MVTLSVYEITKDCYMKMLLSIILTLITLTNASALIIKGEDSENHFLQIKQIPNSEKFTFLECRGDILKAACKPLIEKYHIALDPEEIVYMAQKKKWDSAKTVVADAALIYNLPFLIYHAAFYGSRAYVARYMVGYSVDGVGSVSGSIAMITTAPIVISSPAIFDLLDPSVHNDLGNALKASVDNDSDFDLIREYEGINLEIGYEIDSKSTDINPNSKPKATEKVVTIDDLSTKDIIKSYTKLISMILSCRERGKNCSIEDQSNLTPVQKLLKKKMIGL